MKVRRVCAVLALFITPLAACEPAGCYERPVRGGGTIVECR